jgi:hypothetical protein
VADYNQEHPMHIQLEPGNISGELVKTGFSFSFHSGQLPVQIWGRGTSHPGVFFNENLPSFFIRHLQFHSFSFREGLFEWVFTGDQGACNLAISRDSIWFFQRYYDSYGFNKLKGGEIYLKRHPETIWLMQVISYSGKPENITISLDHRMILKLYINGIKVSEQACLFDLTEHQLRFNGREPSITGDLLQPATGGVQISVNWQSKKQKMIGWGGIATPMAYHLLSEKGKEM